MYTPRVYVFSRANITIARVRWIMKACGDLEGGFRCTKNSTSSALEFVLKLCERASSARVRNFAMAK